MPRFKKITTIEVPQSAMALFDALVEEEGYELTANDPSATLIEVEDDYDDDEDDDED